MLQKLEDVYELKTNGSSLKVYYKPQFNTQYTSMELPFGGLSKYLLTEDKIVNVMPGAAHLLEHIALDTTNNNFFSAFMKMGARCNGYTHLASTVFNFEMVNLDFCVLEKFLSHIFKKDFSQNLIEKQKRIVLSEINSRSTFPPMIKLGLKRILGNDYNYFTVIGEDNDVQMLNEKKLVLLKKNIYNFNQLDLITFGPKNPNEVMDWYETAMKLSSEESPIRIKRSVNDKSETKGIVVDNQVNQMILIFKDEILDSKQMVKRQILMGLFVELCTKGYVQINNKNIEAHMDYFHNLGISILLIKAPNSSELDTFKAIISTSKKDIFEENITSHVLGLVKIEVMANLLGNYDYPDRIST